MGADAWDPRTFNRDLTALLTEESHLIRGYYSEDRRLMDEHFSSSPYQSLKPNPFSSAQSDLLENRVAPLLKNRRIRVWHYTRLTHEEVARMSLRVEPSSITHLRARLNALHAADLLSPQEVEEILSQSPLHQQPTGRAGRLWSTTLPLPVSDSGVTPLLESWGGESAHFWLRDAGLAERLRTIGVPRVVEIETELSERLNAFSVAKTVLEAWAMKLGVQVRLGGSDLSISDDISTARVLRVHSEGDDLFGEVGLTYPNAVEELPRE